MRKHAKLLNRSLVNLGIGTGGEVGSSGEWVALDLLCSNPYFNNSQICIFDVGANIGKYTTLCLKHMGGGG